MKNIFKLVEKLIGHDRSDQWLDTHNKNLDDIPSRMMLSEQGRKVLYDYLNKMHEENTKFLRLGKRRKDI